MKKRILFLALALSVTMGLCGCGEKADVSVKTDDTLQEEEYVDSSEITEDSLGDVEETIKNVKEETVETMESESDAEVDEYLLSVNNIVYEFPISFDEFVAEGWVPTNANYTMEDVGNVFMAAGGAPNSMLPEEELVYVSNGDIAGVVVRVTNADAEDKQLVKDCQITGLDFSLRRDMEVKFFPEGSVQVVGDTKSITIGISTKEDVEALFGDELYLDSYRTDELNISFEYDDNNIVEGITYKTYNWEY